MPYQCTTCSRSFIRRGNLQRHSCNVCDVCAKHFPTRKRLELHICANPVKCPNHVNKHYKRNVDENNKNTLPKLLDASTINKSVGPEFSSENLKNVPNKTTTVDKPIIQCELNKDNLTTHNIQVEKVNVHTEINDTPVICIANMPYQCTTCSRSFIRSVNLQRHSCNVCDVCAKHFPTQKRLELHICANPVTCPNHVNKHYKTNVDENNENTLPKLLDASTINKSVGPHFSSENLKNLPNKTTTVDKQIKQCEFNKANLTRDNIEVEKGNVHTEMNDTSVIYNGNMPYQCTTCSRSFIRRCNLQRHSCNVCDVCAKHFPTRKRLELHICANPVPCPNHVNKHYKRNVDENNENTLPKLLDASTINKSLGPQFSTQNLKNVPNKTTTLHKQIKECQLNKGNLSRDNIEVEKGNVHTEINDTPVRKGNYISSNICSCCGKQFVTSQQLNVHICAHSVKCLCCLNMFSSNKYLQQHKCLYCSTCDKIYSSFVLKQNHKCNYVSKMTRKKDANKPDNGTENGTNTLNKQTVKNNHSDVDKTEFETIHEQDEVNKTNIATHQNSNTDNINTQSGSATFCNTTNTIDTPLTCFNTIDLNWQTQTCNRINDTYHTSMTVINAHSNAEMKNIASPAKCRSITADGNCFFRSISYVITGDELYHHSMRQILLLHMCSNQLTFKSLLPENITMMEYLAQSKMSDSSVWATQVEIFAMAHFLKTDIFVYAKWANSMEWQKHSATSVDASVLLNDKHIYLNNEWRDHYTVVLDVVAKPKLTSMNLQEYFRSQSSMQAMHTRNRKEANKIQKPLLQVLQQRLRNRHQMRICRKSLSSPVKKAHVHKHNARKRNMRESLTPCVKKALAEKDISRKRKMRQSLSPSAKKAVAEKEKARLQNTRRSLSATGKRSTAEKDISRKRKMRQSLSPSAKKAVAEKEKARLQNTRRSLSATGKRSTAEKDISRKRKMRQSLSPSAKKAVAEKEKARLQNTRRSLSATGKRSTAEKDISRKRNMRQSLPATAKKAMTEKDISRKRKMRQSLPATAKKAMTEKDISRKRKMRQSLPATAKKAMTEKYISRKRKMRQSLPATAKQAMTEKDISRKRKMRQSLPATAKQAMTEKDRSRKRHLRQSVPPDVKQANAEKDRQRKHKFAQSVAPDVRIQLATRKKDRQRNFRERSKSDIDHALSRFQSHINDYPEYICTSCNRMMYKKSVVLARRRCFSHTDESILNICITGKVSAEEKEWICQTCQRHIRNNKIPPQSNANALQLPPVPEELQGLTTLEERLISQRYPFMKLLALPKGRQSGIKGAVVNIPVSAEEVCQTLPKTPNEAGFLPLKLKRKLEYSGHHVFQYIRPHRVKQAISRLNQNNYLYADVLQRPDWEEACENEDKDVWMDLTEPTHVSDGNVNDPMEFPSTAEDSDTNRLSADNTDHEESNYSSTEQLQDLSDDPGKDLHGISFDTCLQPSDPTLDINRIVSIAPGEGKRPMNIFSDKKFEELSFPTLFPSGKFGWTHVRPVPLTAKKYFQRRILQCDGKFASNIEYLFVAQFVTEWQQVCSSISIALRKSFSKESTGSSFNALYFKNSDRVKDLLSKDEAYKFLRPVRGSPPYWQQVMYKLLAAVKQFKIFTWFLALSAADLRWTDTLQAISRQQGQMLSADAIQNMSWDEKCALLKSNPVTAARHFNHKIQSLFTDVILSAAAPLGKITNYFYRIEFQQRGSPHAHAILWVDDAPIPEDDPKKICQFIDKYVQATVPSNDDILKTLVTQLQVHSHSGSCRKKSNTCRFSFPKPPTDETIMSPALVTDGVDSLEAAKKRKWATVVISSIQECLLKHSDLSGISLDSLLQDSKVSIEQYHEALSTPAKAPLVFLKRNPADINVNNYNAHLLSVWKANMDLQYVVSPYAAIHYIAKYVTKDEREVGQVLQAVSKEMRDKSVSHQMKKVADAFANARTVSAQEAAYRLLGLPLYVSNFKTVWIPTGFPEKRIRILKAQSVLDSLDDGEEDVFATNLLDRYEARPPTLEKMCLAEFSMWYETTISKPSEDPDDNDADYLDADSHHQQRADNLQHQDNSTNSIQLAKDLGKMRKRHTPAVIRYHKCSLTKEPEQYFYNKMLVFMAWRNEVVDLLADFESYSEHYHSKKVSIDANENSVMSNADLVDETLEDYYKNGPPTHIWDQVAPETEHVEADAAEEGPMLDEDHTFVNPDGHSNVTFNNTEPTDRGIIPLAVEVIPNFRPEPDFRKLVCSLNSEQRSIFQHLLNWCHIVTAHVDRHPAEYLFVTGGAGTGKSHLIKAIQNMANIVFRKAGDDPSNIYVLLMAPTGTAAFNIGAVTIHAALLLPKNLKVYMKLSDDKCSKLRVKLSSLKIVIIDEISLVGSDMIIYIDRRLQQVKDSTHPFGGVSVIVFGDLYQLPPVCQPFVFDLPTDDFERLSGSVWHRNFKATELHEIMRQKDDQLFATLLNRVRKGIHTNEDIQVMHSRVVKPTDEEYRLKSLHIFARNVDVDHHNNVMMLSLGHPVVTLVAKEKRPACLKDYKVTDDPRYTGGVTKEIAICLNARVMITRNIDVQDGLVNGAHGIVVGLIPNTMNAQLVQAILIKFDKPSIGSTAVSTSRFNMSAYPRDHIPITPIDIQFTVARNKQGLEITWTQFPIKLAFACTIHKVQGSTLDSIVVSFKSRFSSGQAYVALSRSRTLQGLQLLDFDPSKIKTNPRVEEEMTRLTTDMLLPSPYNLLQAPMSCSILKLGLLNASSLTLHYKDIMADPVVQHCDIIAFTETHLRHSNVSQYLIKHFTVFMKEQSTCAHGIAFYVHNSYVSQESNLPQHVRMELLCVDASVNTVQPIKLILLYRSPSISKKDFLYELQSVLEFVQQTYHGLVVLMGDFNIDALNTTMYSSLKSLMHQHGFTGIINSPTHQSGSCLDHIYMSHKLSAVQSVIPTYYSDHFFVHLQIPMP